ncbi:RluA family pseudouridine synthase [Lactococcus kimchii]|uniref:RluA family pseudouridine synthase n=1 Tax=Lactococcus sp. S-13 TaxID=2507158 RepID=UPI0010230983|nr:RluA family pseudouridine synthase [Lactococcus sp. S-13]RZI49270.1 RluA family pseudouridine synthase [Lactococcus sp. S-13]
MEFNFILPENFTEQSVSHLLEKTWLIPRKQRHFLRMKKHILVNNTLATDEQLLVHGDKITLIFDADDFSPLNVQFGQAQLADILYEDEHLVIANKPEGMKTHGNSPGEIALQNHVAAALKQPVFVVHRLDEATSGAVLFAKNQFVLPILGKMFEQNEIHREYLALVDGKVKKDHFTIKQAIGRNRHDKRKYLVTPTGLSAITHVELIKQFSTTSLVKCRLETGRTHQIRVHLSANGYPIVGDMLYGKANKQRMMLHAYKILLREPFTSEKIEVSAPSPHFEQIIQAIK